MSAYPRFLDEQHMVALDLEEILEDSLTTVGVELDESDGGVRVMVMVKCGDIY